MKLEWQEEWSDLLCYCYIYNLKGGGTCKYWIPDIALFCALHDLVISMDWLAGWNKSDMYKSDMIKE